MEKSRATSWEAYMITCFPSMAPKQCGKFHLLSNSVAISNHSYLKVSALMNPFLLKTYHIARKVSKMILPIVVGLIL